jgi:hypothetical protein
MRFWSTPRAARSSIPSELTDLLESGHLAGAGLDVYEHEPAVPERLRQLAEQGRVLLLPHMGSATVESRIEMGEKVIINIKTFTDGHHPPDRGAAAALTRSFPRLQNPPQAVIGGRCGRSQAERARSNWPCSRKR